jgi:hypothetical protein
MPEHSNAYRTLKHFIRDEMRMSHIYQPVMLMKLLQNRGKAKIRDIAKSLLSHDQSQIEYYEQITKNMVGRVLTKNRGLTERLDDEYRRDTMACQVTKSNTLFRFAKKKLPNTLQGAAVVFGSIE